MLVGIGTFAVLRIRNAPARRQRASRFYGSHTRAAWVILGMISLVVVTLLLYRAAQVNTGVFPFGDVPLGLRLLESGPAAGRPSARTRTRCIEDGLPPRSTSR